MRPMGHRSAACVSVDCSRRAERTRRVSGVVGVRSEARSPGSLGIFGGLRWLRGSDLNRRPLGYEEKSVSVGLLHRNFIGGVPAPFKLPSSTSSSG
jgi:hypothetical protein